MSDNKKSIKEKYYFPSSDQTLLGFNPTDKLKVSPSLKTTPLK